jgi:hypothetical protein
MGNGIRNATLLFSQQSPFVHPQQCGVGPLRSRHEKKRSLFVCVCVYIVDFTLGTGQWKLLLQLSCETG